MSERGEGRRGAGRETDRASRASTSGRAAQTEDATSLLPVLALAMSTSAADHEGARAQENVATGASASGQTPDVTVERAAQLLRSTPRYLHGQFVALWQQQQGNHFVQKVLAAWQRPSEKANDALAPPGAAHGADDQSHPAHAVSAAARHPAATKGATTPSAAQAVASTAATETLSAQLAMIAARWQAEESPGARLSGLAPALQRQQALALAQTALHDTEIAHGVATQLELLASAQGVLATQAGLQQQLDALTDDTQALQLHAAQARLQADIAGARSRAAHRALRHAHRFLGAMRVINSTIAAAASCAVGYTPLGAFLCVHAVDQMRAGLVEVETGKPEGGFIQKGVAGVAAQFTDEQHAQAIGNWADFIVSLGAQGAFLRQQMAALVPAATQTARNGFAAAAQTAEREAPVVTASVAAAESRVSAPVATGGAGAREVATAEAAVRPAVAAPTAAPAAMPDAIPTITPASNHEMYKQAVAILKQAPGAGAEKAALFEGLVEQITAISRGSWTATRSSGTAGESIFLGGALRILVITKEGKLFVGHVSALEFQSLTTAKVLYPKLSNL